MVSVVADPRVQLRAMREMSRREDAGIEAGLARSEADGQSPSAAAAALASSAMDGYVRLLRATRANPPSLAGRSETRRRVYAAALQQAEDLFAAAAAVGPVARPLPLFYAVSQAGRAIAAAHLEEDWEPRGHGLTEDRARSEWKCDDILRFHVKPAGEGVFAAAATAMGNGGLSGSVPLGELWAALPLVRAPEQATEWRSALFVVPDPAEASAVVHLQREHHAVVLLPDHPTDAESVDHLLSHYPAAAGARLMLVEGNLFEQHTPYGPGVPVVWPAAPVTADGRVADGYVASMVRNRVPQYRFRGEHWLVPRVGESDDELSPLLLWWVLLFGLSLLARYEPAAWQKALEPDLPGVAVLLETLLDEALVDLPRLLADALTGHQLLEPARH
jgi:hypothetical protein